MKIEGTIAFGPVPSRRLGRSLGINNIPPKTCSYSCVYCQIGRTSKMQSERMQFYDLADVVEGVNKKIRDARALGENIDYLAFVPDGEPSLDKNLGKEIKLLKDSGIKIAVISNASLVWMPDVREDLLHADWVSLKIDAANERTWRKIDRPHRSLEYDRILQGISMFSDEFDGRLVTETMLVKGFNDDPDELGQIADLIEELKPWKSYISIPTRPPAEMEVVPPNETRLNMAYQIFKDRDLDVEYLTGYEGNSFAFTGNAEEDLLGIVSVHPMRKDAVIDFLTKANADWDLVENLKNEGSIVEVIYDDKKFYMKKILGSKRGE